MAGTTLSVSTSLDQKARAFEPPAHAIGDPSTSGVLKQLTVKDGGGLSFSRPMVALTKGITMRCTFRLAFSMLKLSRPRSLLWPVCAA